MSIHPPAAYGWHKNSRGIWHHAGDPSEDESIQADIDELAYASMGDPQHGTHTGYYAHERVGQTPCAECRAAHSAAQRRKYWTQMAEDPEGARARRAEKSRRYRARRKEREAAA